MIFTRHAAERYLQFHMLDQPTATIEDAYARLLSHTADARKTGGRSHRGDPVWSIDSLGIELVAKHENGADICVTILPPPRFRGLTPLQAEVVAARRDALQVQVAEVEQERTAARASVQETIGSDRAAAQRELTQTNRCHRDLVAERDIMAGALKTMRTQLAADEQHQRMRRALKIALRALRDGSPATLAFELIREIDPGLASDAFVDSVSG